MDILIKGGMIYDGTGTPPFPADVCINSGEISDVSRIGDVVAAKIIDAAGKVVCPGFIDIHTHADIAVLEKPRHEPKILQGVTTDVFTNCGLGFAPTDTRTLPMQREYLGSLFGDCEKVLWNWRTVGEYLLQLQGGCSVNTAYLIAHGAIRTSVMGMDNRPPTVEELKEMKCMVAQGMEEGARGLSFGLAYAPMCYAESKECIQLCEAAVPFGGFFAIHMRSYKEKVLESTLESIEICRKSGYALQISHFFAGGRKNRHLAPKIIEEIDRAKKEGLDVMFDTYPYLAGSSILTQFLPLWALEGGGEKAMSRLTDPLTKSTILKELISSDLEWDNILISEINSVRNKSFEGKSIAVLSEERNVDPPTFLCDLLVEEKLQGTFVMFTQKEDTLREFMKHSAHMAGSDALHIGGKVHPRLYGCYPRYLGKYVRETGTLNWESAIKKMTSLPAGRLGLKDRGILRKGMKADIVVFDPDEIIDTATFDDPHQFPVGIEYVLVNGEIVADHGRHTGALPGKVLYRQ